MNICLTVQILSSSVSSTNQSNVSKFPSILNIKKKISKKWIVAQKQREKKHWKIKHFHLKQSNGFAFLNYARTKREIELAMQDEKKNT